MTPAGENKPVIAFLGTGLLGRPMAEKLLDAGYAVRAFNRTRAKAEPLAAKGAVVCDTPAAAIDGSAVVITMLTDGPAVDAVLFSDPAVALDGKTVVQMGTIGPEESRRFLREVRARNGGYLECPVLGSIPQARDGSLILMMGGTPEQFERWKKVLMVFGSAPRRIGEVGQAAALKLAFNQMIASQITAFSFSLGLVQRSGINEDDFLGLLRQSALYAPAFDNKLARLRNRDYASPNFPARHLAKDVDLSLALAGELGVMTDHLRGVRAVITRALKMGHGDGDYAGLYEAVNPPSNISG